MYTIELSFTIPTAQITNLTAVGKPIELGLAYMRALLPSEFGFVTARAMYSIDRPEETLVVFQSVWDEWEDVLNHRKSYLEEQRLLDAFEPAMDVKDVNVRIYAEVP